MNQIYLDNNATTKLLPSAKQAMLELMGSPHNASAVHSLGRKAKSVLEDTRRIIAQMLNFDIRQYNVTFTSSGTEANNIVMHNYQHSKIIISAIEHSSILGFAQYNDNILKTKVQTNGLIDLDHLEQLLIENDDISLISVMAVNNETGVIQPLKEVIALAQKYNVKIHCDASQAIGKVPFAIDDLSLDFVTISAHKFGGPLGVGLFINKANILLKPYIIGGGQEKGLRSGTENIYAIAGLKAAAEAVINGEVDFDKARKLRDYMEYQLQHISPDIIIHGLLAPRVGNTSLVAMPNVDRNIQIMRFDMAGIYLSSGSACSSGKVKISHVLQAMGVAEDIAQNTVRISLGYNQEPEDIDNFVREYYNIYNQLNHGEKYA